MTIGRGNLDTDVYKGKRIGRHSEMTAINKTRREASTDPSFTALRRNQDCCHLEFIAFRTERQ